jgi:dihydropteroate synthase
MPEPSAQYAFSRRATAWKLRTRTLAFGRRPLLMGILNVTPDSFSDGGAFFASQQAIEHGITLFDEGADILDVGGESTRPYSTPVTTADEIARVEPVLRGIIAARPEAIVSIDTSKPEVAEAALSLGAEIINDVTGLADSQMIELATARGAAVCAMHMQGTPQTMQDKPTYTDVVAEIFDYLRERRNSLLAAGLEPARICLDPGIGFGKTHAHNLQLMAACHRFHALGCPLLVGHSRKGFIGHVLGDKTADRDAGTLGAGLALARQGVQVLRVHAIRPLCDALQMFEACGGLNQLSDST